MVLDGRDVVIRFGAHGEDFAKDALMTGYAGDALPIPAVVELGAAPGGFFAVSVRARGVFLDDVDEAGMRAVLPALLAMLHTVRSIDVSGSQGYGLWRTDGSAPHQSGAAKLLDITQDSFTVICSTQRAGGGRPFSGGAGLGQLGLWRWPV